MLNALVSVSVFVFVFVSSIGTVRKCRQNKLAPITGVGRAWWFIVGAWLMSGFVRCRQVAVIRICALYKYRYQHGWYCWYVVDGVYLVCRCVVGA